jgi:hypothetical protein
LVIRFSDQTAALFESRLAGRRIVGGREGGGKGHINLSA